MKRRIACLCLILTTLLSACGIRKEPLPSAPVQGSYSQEEPLMATVDSEEAVKELAELYGITLVEFRGKIASFYTVEDLRQVIQRGEEYGWTPLEINYIQNAN